MKIKVVFIFSFIGLVISESKNSQQIEKNVLEVINGIRKSCQSPSEPPLMLDQVRLPTVNINDLIFGADLFNIFLINVKLKQLDKFIIQGSSTKFFKDHLRAITQVQLNLPKILIESGYVVNGSIGEVFPVFGKGFLKIKYYNVSVSLALHLTLHSNGNDHSFQASLDYNGLRVKSIDFDNSTLNVQSTAAFSSQIAFDNERKHLQSSRVFENELSKVLFWRLTFIFGKQIKPYLEKCFNHDLGKQKIWLSLLNKKYSLTHSAQWFVSRPHQ